MRSLRTKMETCTTERRMRIFGVKACCNTQDIIVVGLSVDTAAVESHVTLGSHTRQPRWFPPWAASNHSFPPWSRASVQSRWWGRPPQADG